MTQFSLSVRLSFSWCVCPCTARGRGWGWPTSWLSALPVLVSHPEVRRAQPPLFPPHWSDVLWLPSAFHWTDSFPSVSWTVTSASSWWGTLGVWGSLAGAGRGGINPWVPTLVYREETQWDLPHVSLSSLLSPSVALALNLPVHRGCSAAWISLSSQLLLSPPASSPLSPVFPPPSDSLSPCFSLGCSAWSSVESSCGGGPHLCRSCAGWWCRPLCWRRWSATTKIPTGSSGWSSGTWPRLPLKRGEGEPEIKIRAFSFN